MDTVSKNSLSQLESLLAAGGSAYRRLELLFDAGTFVELGRFVKKETTLFDGEPGGEFEGVVTGYGAVDGKLVFAYSQDFSRMKGAMSEAHAKKIVAVYDAAMKSGAPVVGIFDSAGAKVLEGVSVLSGYGSMMKAAAAASGVIPQIAVIAGPCSGSAATFASMADIVIGVKETGKFYVNSPFALSKKGAVNAGSIEEAAKNGAVSIAAENESEAIGYAKKLITLLPSNSVEGTAYNEVGDSANRAVTGTGELSQIVSELVDSGTLLPLCKDFAPETGTDVASIGGITVGIVASGTSLSDLGAEKAAKFVSFCDSFSIPVVTLVDCEGVAFCAECEKALAVKTARLAAVYAVSTTPKITVITGKAYGSVFTLLGSKTLGADLVYSTPDARISVMPAEAAVEFLYADRVKASADPAGEKEKAKAEWDEICAPVNAARNGDIDDVIDPSELRMRVAAGLEMLSGKATVTPYRKHGNLPL